MTTLPDRLDALPALVATDLDGTLVRSDNTVSAYSHDVLKRLSALGVTVVAITGRGPRLLELCRTDIPSADYLVMAQGGFVYRCDAGGDVTPLHSTMMSAAVARRIVEHVETVTGPLTVIVENEPTLAAPLVGDAVSDWPFPVPIVPLTRDEAMIGDIVKTFIRSATIPPLDLLATARDLVPMEWCALTEPGTGFVEICPPGVDKARGLEFVCSLLGVPADRTLVFGDAGNDLPMFGWAGRTVAMANAHPDVIAAADELTGRNDADGVARYLERLYGL